MYSLTTPRLLMETEVYFFSFVRCQILFLKGDDKLIHFPTGIGTV